MPTDLDGDSEMLSSPESDKYTSGPNDPRTPQAPSRSGLTSEFPTSELSPPGSQDIHNKQQQQRQQQETTMNEGLGSVSAAFANSRKAIEKKDTERTEAKNAPGASWMNKRAEEEYQRAMEYVVDGDFSLRGFGDPFDEREVSQAGT